MKSHHLLHPVVCNSLPESITNYDDDDDDYITPEAIQPKGSYRRNAKPILEMSNTRFQALKHN
jgi:hypothetical protein